MREIIHIQAGKLSNYVGTHLFNTLESYFSYENSATQDNVVDHDVSFRTGIGPDGGETFCPRLLLFDYQTNFGALGKTSALYLSDADTSKEVDVWEGGLDINEQLPVDKGDYQRSLEKMESKEDMEEATLSKSIRYWSDFNRVYHAPRSLHPLPDLPDGIHGDSSVYVQTWDTGLEFFRQINKDKDIIEDDWRRFIEESDLLQGVHLSFDVAPWAPFGVSMLEIMRDELPKAPILTFAILPETQFETFDDYINPNPVRQAINECLTLHSLADLSSISIPLSNPLSLETGNWSSLLDPDFTSPYHSSAVLSSHVESALLPLRLKQSDADMRQLCDILQGSENLRFAQLSGIVPLDIGIEPSWKITESEYDFTLALDYSALRTSGRETFAQWSVIRGLDKPEQVQLQSHLSTIASPLMQRRWIPLPYPIPTSFPQFFDRRVISPLGKRYSISSVASNKASRVSSVPVYSTLRGTSAMSKVFVSRAAYISNFLRHGGDPQVLGPTTSRDDLRELQEDMIQLSESFGGANAIENHKKRP